MGKNTEFQAGLAAERVETTLLSFEGWFGVVFNKADRMPA